MKTLNIEKLVIEQYGLDGVNTDVILGIPEEQAGYEFSYRGCELLCDGLGNSVIEVELIAYDNGHEVVNESIRVCNEVLDAYHNGTEYTLDENGSIEHACDSVA